MDALIRKDCLVCLESDVVRYGISFTISQKWSKNVFKYRKRSDCITVMQIIQNPLKQINKYNFINTCLCLTD